jgi:acetyl-CoA acetyltransferase family protein
MVAPKHKNRRVAIVSGVRTPFAKAGDALAKLHVTDLAATALRETLYRAPWPVSRIDEVVLGNVIMPADATNPARVAALGAGIARTTPALTVQRNCASGMEAIANGAMKIQSHRADAILAGGAESMSRAPLLLPAESAAPLGALAKAKTFTSKLAAVAQLRPRHFKPIPSLLLGLTDPTCQLNMGQTAELLAQDFQISRADQDAFALESHRRAVAAADSGRFDDEITPVYVPDQFKPLVADVGPRPEQTIEALRRLRPIFDRKDGSVTVGNACPITDGAAALLLMDAELAKAEGLTILGYVQDWATAALDPSRMGLGPVFAIHQLLAQTELTLGDIGLIEINEAFASQVLACLQAMDSSSFAEHRLDGASAIGSIDPDRLNVNGGAIALGHPVGATGARLVLTLLYEMRRRSVEKGIASLCVGGGQGMAMLLELA